MDPFRVTVTFPHRKSASPRSKVVHSVRTFDIPQVASADAPVVMRVPVQHIDARYMSDVRAYQGRLYTPYSARSYGQLIGAATVVAGSADAPAEVTKTTRANLTYDEALAVLEQANADFLVIDGYVWTAINEPVYQIHNSAGHTRLRVTTIRLDGPIHPVTDFTGALASLLTEGTSSDRDDATRAVVVQRPVEVVDASYVHTPVNTTVNRDPRVLAEVFTLRAGAALVSEDLSQAERIDQARHLLFQAALMLDTPAAV